MIEEINDLFDRYFGLDDFSEGLEDSIKKTISYFKNPLRILLWKIVLEVYLIDKIEYDKLFVEQQEELLKEIPNFAR